MSASIDSFTSVAAATDAFAIVPKLYHARHSEPGLMRGAMKSTACYSPSLLSLAYDGMILFAMTAREACSADAAFWQHGVGMALATGRLLRLIIEKYNSAISRASFLASRADCWYQKPMMKAMIIWHSTLKPSLSFLFAFSARLNAFSGRRSPCFEA